MAVWGEYRARELSYQGITWDLPRDPLGSACFPPLPRSPAPPQSLPHSQVPSVPDAFSPLPPAFCLQSPLFPSLCQPLAPILPPAAQDRIQRFPLSPFTTRVAPWGPVPLPLPSGGTLLSPQQDKIWLA